MGKICIFVTFPFSITKSSQGQQLFYIIEILTININIKSYEYHSNPFEVIFYISTHVHVLFFCIHYYLQRNISLKHYCSKDDRYNELYTNLKILIKYF